MKVVSRSFLGEKTFITYPHCNAFLQGGKGLVYLRRQDDILSLYLHDLDEGKTVHCERIGPCSEVGNAIWTDVALDAPRVAAVFGNGAWILDLHQPRGWVQIYESGPSAKLDGLSSLSKDGRRLLCRETREGVHWAIEIDLASGKARELFSKDWFANHFHYCPHDETWVAFSHEGPAADIRDRCWIWHAEKAPQGRLAFDQESERPGVPLCVGHERWGFHDVSAYVPAYAVSPAGKRGLYEIFGDGRPARLLWENDVLWHCTMDPTGRFVAVDTTGPFQEGKLGDPEFRDSMELHLKTDRERGINASDVAVIDLKTRKVLPIAKVFRAQHPYHPHPAISPNLKWVAWNDSDPARKGAWAAEVQLES